MPVAKHSENKASGKTSITDRVYIKIFSSSDMLKLFRQMAKGIERCSVQPLFSATFSRPRGLAIPIRYDMTAYAVAQTNQQQQYVLSVSDIQSRITIFIESPVDLPG